MGRGRGAGVGAASARSFRPTRRCARFRFHRKQKPQRQGRATPRGTETEAALKVLTPERIFWFGKFVLSGYEFKARWS